MANKPKTIPRTILVVDDSSDTREVLKRNLQAMKFLVYTAENVSAALELLQTSKVDLVITDFKMPGVSGIELVRHVHENLKDTEVMMITGYPSVQGAVDAVKLGADAYLPKPFTDEELFNAVKESFDKLERRRIGAQADPGRFSSTFGMIGQSVPMLQVFNEIEKASSTSATVLITGESGTGKELVARAVHYNGSRANAPFIPVNCGGIPESLLESELFGHVKGAFTGASESRAGFFQAADGGSIFLDEISETSLAMQVKLLRVLQEKEVLMVGAEKARKVDVRIIAATNKDLEILIKKQAFREDLFYRLNVIRISVPPLRERTGDIAILAESFKSKFAKEYEKKELEFTDEVLRAFEDYSWPGNVRELENIIHRLVIMCEGGEIGIQELPQIMRYNANYLPRLDRSLDEVESEYIKRVLESVSWNKTKAAGILGIDRKTLREKIKTYNLEQN